MAIKSGMPLRRPVTEQDLLALEAMLSYQFGREAAKALTSIPLEVELRRGKIRYVYERGSGDRLLTLRPNDFMFTISLRAGEIIRSAVPSPRLRVVVRDDYRGGDVKGLDVIFADPQIRAGDEVLVVSKNDELLAVGKARAPGTLMGALTDQDVVRVREVRKVGKG
ncbi:MAG: PUA domain-containing protein [Acidilobus sp.]